MKKQTNPLILYRYHGHGDIRTIHPIVTKYQTEQEYNMAVRYNILHRPSNALFSPDEIIKQGSLTPADANYILGQIKNGAYQVPAITHNIVNLHSH